MFEDSIYETGHPRRMQQDAAIAFGRVVATNVSKRMVTVKTFLGKGATDDNHVECQWLNIDANPDGDESTSIPRTNTMGLVFYVNGETFFFGGFKALNALGQAVTGDESDTALLEGDKIISTNAGNRITVKASRLIEIFATEGLRRVYSPGDDRILDFCANWQIKTNGGSILWENSGAPLNQTLWSAEYAANINRTTVVYDQIGNVSSTVAYQRDVGTAFPGLRGVSVPFFTESIGIDGTYDRAIGPFGGAFTQTIGPDGSIEISNLTTSISVSPLGDVAVENAIGTFTLSAGGDFNLSNALGTIALAKDGSWLAEGPLASIAATAAGAISIDGSLGKGSFANGQVEFGGPAGALVQTLIDVVKEMIDLGTALTAETHIGNLGYPTAVPTNLSQYVTVVVNLVKLQAILTLMKGSI